MSSRKNFLDADNSMMERNLRFVKNDLEDNLNQYFGGAGGSRGNSTAISAPPREYKVVQPKPGGSHALKPGPDLEERKQFLIKIGLARHEAYNLAKSSDFKVSYYKEIRNNWLKNGLEEKQVNKQLLSEIIKSDYKCDNYKADNIAGDDHQNLSLRKANDGDLDRYNNRSNEINYGNKIMLDEPSEISRYQKYYDIDPDSVKQLEKGDYNLTSYRSTSPSKAFNFMQHGIGVDDNFRSTQTSRLRSPRREFNSKQKEYNYSAGNDVDLAQCERSFERSKVPQKEYGAREDLKKESSSPASGFNFMPQERSHSRGFDNLRSSQSSRSRSPPRGFNSMQQERGRSRDIDNLRSYQASRSRSPPRGFNSMQQERGHSGDFGNLRSSQPSRSRSPPSGFNSMQQERGHSRGFDNLRSSQPSRSRSPPSGFNSMQQERGHSRDHDNLRSSQPSRSRSPPSGFNSMQQERGHSGGFGNLRSSQPSRSRSPPSGFNSMSSKKSLNNNVKDFQLSRMRLISNLCSTSKDRDSFGNKANLVEPLNKMGSEPSSKTSSYGCNVNVPNFHETQMGFVKQLTKPNVAPVTVDYTSLYKRRRDINDQDFGNPMQWEVISPNTTSLRSYTNSTSYDKPSQGYWIAVDNTTKTPPTMGNRNVPPNDSHIRDYGSNSNIQPTPGYWTGLGNSKNISPSKSHNHTPSYDKPSQGYWIGASNSTNIPSLKDYQNAPSNVNPFRDYGSNSNKPTSVDSLLSTPLQLIQHNPFNNPYWPQPATTSEIIKNPTGVTKSSLTFKEQKKLAHKEQLKAASKLKRKKKQEKKRERRLQRLNDPYKPPVSSIPLIACGFKKPPPGRSKAQPQDYWSQWWPHYKYIEKSIQKLNLSLKPEDVTPPPRKNLLLSIGINKIFRNLDITEHNYHIRDIFKLFTYKKQLENPVFQNSLKGFELKRVKAALAQLENKNKMALLHQAIIYRWHFSLDTVKKSKAGELIKSRKAFNLLGDKIFDYFVLESIQQLKEMCKAEWPQFEEFYNSIDATNDETDISTLLFSTKEYSSMAKKNYDEQDDEEDDDEDDEQEDEEIDNNVYWKDKE